MLFIPTLPVKAEFTEKQRMLSNAGDSERHKESWEMLSKAMLCNVKLCFSNILQDSAKFSDILHKSFKLCWILLKNAKAAILEG